MFKVLEPDRRILFMDVQAQTVIGFEDFCGKSDRVFDIPFNDMATNEELLQALHLESMYANGNLRGKEHAIGFFNAYLSSFYNDKGVSEKLDKNPIIRILIQDENKLKKVREILG